MGQNPGYEFICFSPLGPTYMLPPVPFLTTSVSLLFSCNGCEVYHTLLGRPQGLKTMEFVFFFSFYSSEKGKSKAKELPGPCTCPILLEFLPCISPNKAGCASAGGCLGPASAMWRFLSASVLCKGRSLSGLHSDSALPHCSRLCLSLSKVLRGHAA